MRKALAAGADANAAIYKRTWGRMGGTLTAVLLSIIVFLIIMQGTQL